MNKKIKIASILISIGIIITALSFMFYFQTEKEKQRKLEEQAAIQKQKTDLIERIKSPATENIDKLRLLEKLQVLEPSIAAQLKEPVINDINRKAEENKVRLLQQAKQKELEIKQIEKEEKRLKKQQGVSIGMTKQDVLDSNWGKPTHKTTYSSEQGTTEIWQYGTYGEQGALYFENNTLKMIQN